MYEVKVKIGASPSNYWGKLEFTDQKGKVHIREISGERKASKQSNTLEALIQSLKVLGKPCMLNIYSEEDYLIAAFQNGWVNDWQKHDWKNKKGNEVRNSGQWQQVWELLTPHSRRVMKCREA